ncbi:hypothetical protein FAIPA1_160092 [Frankia sp. AiPs1]
MWKTCRWTAVGGESPVGARIGRPMSRPATTIARPSSHDPHPVEARHGMWSLDLTPLVPWGATRSRWTAGVTVCSGMAGAGRAQDPKRSLWGCSCPVCPPRRPV